MSELQSHQFMFEQINYMQTTVHGHSHLSLKCRLSNRISFDVFDRCFCKVETRACETLRICAKRLTGCVRHADVSRCDARVTACDTSCSNDMKYT